MRWRDDHSDSSTGLCLYTRARGRGHACGGSIEELNDLSLSHIYRAPASTSAPRILQDPSALSGRPARLADRSADAARLPTSSATLAHGAALLVGGTQRRPRRRTPLTPTWAATAGTVGRDRRGVRYFPARIGPRSRTEDPQYPIEFVALRRRDDAGMDHSPQISAAAQRVAEALIELVQAAIEASGRPAAPTPASAAPSDHAEYLTLTQAAKIAPGRPSSNGIWRWCRQGVRTRGGTIVRLEHIRAGGKLLTTATWIAEFAHRLAEADNAAFDLRAMNAPPPPPPRRGRQWPVPRPDVPLPKTKRPGRKDQR